MPSFSRMNNESFTTWLTQFINVTDNIPATYKMAQAQIDDLNTKNNNLRAAMMAQAEIIKDNPDISDANKIAAGIEPTKPPSRTPPVAPETLTINGFQNNLNILKWNRAGNKPNTMFVIEYRKEAGAEFVYLDTTTETTYEQKNAIPGERVFYRIKAKCGNEESNWSNEAVVY